MRLGQTSAIYFVSKIVASVFGFLATIYFTRLLGEEVYGQYALVLSLVGALGVVKSIGFGKAMVKRMSEGEEPDEYLAAGSFIKGTLTLIVASGVLVFSDQINAYVGRPVAKFIVLLLVVSIFSGIVNSALQGSHRVHVYAPLSTAKEGARSVAMVLLVFIGWELTGMLVGHAIGTAIIAIVGIWFVKPIPVIPEWRHVIRLFDFAKYSWLGNMRKKTFSEVDILVLGLFVPTGLTGIYAVAYSLSEFLEVFGSSIKTTLFPEMSKRATADNAEMISTLTNDALTYAGLFLVPGVVGAAIIGDRLMLIYGEGFDAGATILVILLIGLIIYTYTKQLLNTLDAIDRPDLAFRANGAFIVANIVLNVLLVYLYGWIGAAVATALSATVGLTLSLFYARRLIDFTVPYGEITRQWTAAVLMGAVVYLARIAAEPTVLAAYNEVFVVLLVGLGAGVYFISLLTISTTFRTTVSRNLPIDVPLL